jgi:hypothetical protein
MTEQPVYVTYSEEVRSVLAKADLDMPKLVRDELAKEGVKGHVKLAPDPTNAGGEERDVFLLILAAGVTASLVGSAVARVIDAVSQRHRASMVEQDLHIALDGQGKPIRDRGGNPVYNTSSKPSPVPPPGKEQSSVVVGKLLKFSFSRS